MTFGRLCFYTLFMFLMLFQTVFAYELTVENYLSLRNETAELFGSLVQQQNAKHKKMSSSQAKLLNQLEAHWFSRVHDNAFVYFNEQTSAQLDVTGKPGYPHMSCSSLKMLEVVKNYIQNKYGLEIKKEEVPISLKIFSNEQLRRLIQTDDNLEKQCSKTPPEYSLSQNVLHLLYYSYLKSDKAILLKLKNTLNQQNHDLEKLLSVIEQIGQKIDWETIEQLKEIRSESLNFGHE